MLAPPARLLAASPALAAVAILMSLFAGPNVRVSRLPEVTRRSVGRDGGASRSDIADTGYGHTAKQVGAVNGDARLLRGYFDAMRKMAIGFVRAVTDFRPRSHRRRALGFARDPWSQACECRRPQLRAGRAGCLYPWRP